MQSVSKWCKIKKKTQGENTMAKKTYTGTMLNPDLEKAQVRIYLFDEVKYEIKLT